MPASSINLSTRYNITIATFPIAAVHSRTKSPVFRGRSPDQQEKVTQIKDLHPRPPLGDSRELYTRKRKVSDVVLTGAAKEGISGLPEKPVQVYSINNGAYFVRVTLPGRETDIGCVRCYFDANGEVVVKGVVNCGEILGPSTRPIVHVSKRRRLSPFGRFSISFKLPGPVETRFSYSRLWPNGTYEILIVMKN